MPRLDVAIRDARRGDADQIAPLLGELGYPTTPAQFTRRFERLQGEPATWIYVAEADRRLVGLAGCGWSRSSRDQPWDGSSRLWSMRRSAAWASAGRSSST